MLNIAIRAPSKRPNHLHGRVTMRPRRMRRIHLSVALGALALAIAGVAHADGLGCCEAECHASDDAGRVMHSKQRRSMTQAACESSFAGCETRWEATPCDGAGGHAVYGEQGGTEHRENGDDDGDEE
jgi:hypothetical protein